MTYIFLQFDFFPTLKSAPPADQQTRELQQSPELMETSNWVQTYISGAALRNVSGEQKAPFQSPGQLISQPVSGDSREVQVQATGKALTVYTEMCRKLFSLENMVQVVFDFLNLYMPSYRKPAQSILWAADFCSVLFGLCQTPGSQRASRGRLQMPGSRPNAFPPQATGEGALQGRGTEHRGGQR